MSSRRHRLLTHAALAGTLSLAIALAGCSKGGDDAGNTGAAALPALPATLPMTDAPARQAALAPPIAAIPATRRIRAVRVADPRAAYAYADQADSFSQSLGDGPPDYGFDYDGVRPWAWQGYDGSRVFLEPVEGGYRYYYYRTGADQPYFIRDPDYAYGFDGGQLAAVYGPDGGLVPYADYGPRLGFAAAYLWRAERLFEASRDRQAIAAADWADRQDSIVAYRERWAANRDRQADWAAYHAEEAAQESRYWAEEAARRDADQQRFAAWRQQDFRTPPPPRAIPPAWQQASWAQDTARYAPIAATATAGGGALAWFVHHRQAMTAPREAAPPQAVARQQPLMAAPFDRNGQERFAAPPGRPPEPAVREVHASSSSPAARPAVAAHAPDTPRGPSEAMRQQAPETRTHAAMLRHGAAPGFPAMRPAEQVVVVHAGNRVAPRIVAMEAMHAEGRHVAVSSPMARMGAPPPRRMPAAERPPAAPARRPEVEQRPAGGDRPDAHHAAADHPGGGHPGGHPEGGGHGDHRH